MKKRSAISLLILIVALIAINLLSNIFFHRFDFTGDKRFTLNEKTKSILQKNDKPIIGHYIFRWNLATCFQTIANKC